MQLLQPFRAHARSEPPQITRSVVQSEYAASGCVHFAHVVDTAAAVDHGSRRALSMPAPGGERGGGHWMADEQPAARVQRVPAFFVRVETEEVRL